MGFHYILYGGTRNHRGLGENGTNRYAGWRILFCCGKRPAEALTLRRHQSYTMNYTAITEENRRRHARYRDCGYNPLSGEGCCGERLPVEMPGGGKALVPVAMLRDPEYSAALTLREFETLRMRHDFEFWCAKCVTVKDKAGYRDIKLTLNRPQRIILQELEAMRTAGRPIRAIILKARQCGISTLIQTYMAWIQLTQRDNWHSLVCAHVRDVAATIKNMMVKLLARYPQEYLPDGNELRLRPFEGSRNISRIEGRQNTITICSAENQEAARGSDIAMAHLSEVAFWRETPGHDPNDIIRSVSGSVALAELTLIIMESTANGVGNFFHTEWLRAKAGESDKRPVFIPWYEYGIYSLPVGDVGDLWNSLDDYERKLWDMGLTLEQIAWYHAKRREYASHKAMKAEYPTTDIEAFTSTDRIVFDREGVERLRQDCCRPEQTGDMAGDAATGRKALQGVKFVPSDGGLLKIWKNPAKISRRDSRYITVVDVGGRSDTSDWSVIAVIDRGEERGQKPELAAQWRGHTDHDLLAWKAAQIALYYNKALLAIESNTLETESTEGSNAGYILDEIADHYPNIYCRNVYDRLTGTCSPQIGFHTNRSTKPLVVNHHIATVRDSRYVEHDMDAVDEHASYERKPNGSYGAKEGCHDDILMTRCIGLYIADLITGEEPPDITPLKRPPVRRC